MTLQAQHLCCLKGDRMLFRNLAFTLSGGELLRVAGANGCGKSSLLRILCGLAAPEAGDVLWQGVPIRKQRDAYHRALLYVGHSAALNDRLSPLENLRFACAIAGDAASDAAIDAALEQVGLQAQANLPLHALSQGQRKRTSLARLFLARQRGLWILDEPFAALDVQAVAVLSRQIEAHCDAGGMALLTTHQEGAFTRQPVTLDIGDWA